MRARSIQGPIWGAQELNGVCVACQAYGVCSTVYPPDFSLLFVESSESFCDFKKGFVPLSWTTTTSRDNFGSPIKGGHPAAQCAAGMARSLAIAAQCTNMAFCTISASSSCWPGLMVMLCASCPHTPAPKSSHSLLFSLYKTHQDILRLIYDDNL